MPRNLTLRTTAIGRCVLLLLGVGTAALLTGCPRDARRRIAQSSSGDPPPVAAATQPAAPSPTAAENPAPWMGSTTQFTSWHAPFGERECRKCHVGSVRQAPQADFSSVCAECHESLFAYRRFGHAPVVSRDCEFCHFTHVSRYEALLTAPQQKLCTSCHPAQQNENALDGYHRGIEALNCTACHDPHFADNQLLLRPEEVRQRAGRSAASSRP